MMARSAPAAKMTHFAQESGHQKIAKTTMPKARTRRQKHNFMINLSFIDELHLSYMKNIRKFKHSFNEIHISYKENKWLSVTIPE